MSGLPEQSRSVWQKMKLAQTALLLEDPLLEEPLLDRTFSVYAHPDDNITIDNAQNRVTDQALAIPDIAIETPSL